ncbi:hypothetical protein ACHAWF_000992 [Thalassiosira exigua]
MTRQAHRSLLLLASAALPPSSTVSAFTAAGRSALAVSRGGSASGSSPAGGAGTGRALTTRAMSVLDSFFPKKEYGGSCVMGDESIMSQKSHGTSETPVQKDLRWECDVATADRICNFNRHYAEHAGYWTSTTFVKEAREEYEEKGAIEFYDSNTGKPLFVAPKGRDLDSFLKESASHGWPSFRDEEVIWDNVRTLGNGESVSVDGTHLGHNLPDGKGNRYCINLVSVAGRPEEGK